MKKQFLFLSLFLLAVFAGMNQSYAQTPFDVRTLDCVVTEGPLNPLLGKTYTYSVTVPNNTEFVGTAGITYRWRVTTDQTFITAGALTATALSDGTAFDDISGNYNVADPSEEIQLSWNALPPDPSTPYFLIVEVVGDNGVCQPQNMKVYKILPVNQFTLDIASYDILNGTQLGWEADGTATVAEQCYSDIVSAYYNPATGDVSYDYGTNTFVWAVAAANWSDSWTPTLQISGVDAGELISSVTWNTAADGSGSSGSFTDSGLDSNSDGLNEWTTTDVVTHQGASTDIDEAGEVIYIIMELDHTDPATSTFFEGLIDQTITMAIDGVTANGDGDVHFQNTDTAPGGTADCGEVDNFENDLADQTIKQRPRIDTNTEPGELPADQDPFLTPVSIP
tara:strand:+ start:4220 stop:5401 length:1182 start_codon:yes stop_codon:yes gene_type:complete